MRQNITGEIFKVPWRNRGCRRQFKNAKGFKQSQGNHLFAESGFRKQLFCLFVLVVVMSNSFAMPWTEVCQAPLSMEIHMQEYWNRLLFSSSGDLPNPGIKPVSPALAGRFCTTKSPRKPNWGGSLMWIAVGQWWFCTCKFEMRVSRENDDTYILIALPDTVGGERWTKHRFYFQGNFSSTMRHCIFEIFFILTP